MTDPRLDDALARAGELAAGIHPLWLGRGYLAGWAQAVKALWMDGHSFDPDEVFHADCDGCKAIATFCDAMLGPE